MIKVHKSIIRRRKLIWSICGESRVDLLSLAFKMDKRLSTLELYPMFLKF